ncbi:hypothetical protein Clacol_006900 [Clathrus columnatus]|uniref:protein-histidine N-methyltransferase n=1 Tax=Clathrus columnatus TaxID=1419009 RepID=A0AAV5AI87_9AGAM|nr:hypothetical protein Clacol_006900 [Clathrus columnatus]
MFKFDFKLEELEDDENILDIPNDINDHVTPGINTISSVPFNVYSISDLISTLPSAISYSPVKIPKINSSSSATTLYRRDLFDARYQLISEDDDSIPTDDRNNDNENLLFIDAPSDLMPGVYEGGLKTWECSLDLAGYLASLDLDRSVIGNDELSILEIGCGTAIPSLYCLKYLFSKPPSAQTSRTIIHLQDYNAVVLKLMTLPNVILSWYMSPASEAYRKTLPEDQDSELAMEFTLEFTEDLIAAFQNSLTDYHIEFRFISGSWEDTNTWITENRIKFDLILSSETVYQISSLPHLITLLHNSVSNVPPPLCLIAAKVVYFGVGGGVESFVKSVTDRGGRSETVFETKTGVARKIMKISWS